MQIVVYHTNKNELNCHHLYYLTYLSCILILCGDIALNRLANRIGRIITKWSKTSRFGKSHDIDTLASTKAEIKGVCNTLKWGCAGHNFDDRADG